MMKAFWETYPNTTRKGRKGKFKKIDPLKDLINFKLAQKKWEGDEEGFQKKSNKGFKMNIEKVEDKWNAEKF